MEASNMKAMREALKLASYFLHEHHMGAVRTRDGRAICCWDVAKVVDAALSAPPRNCDVGTAEEQYKRYCDFTRRCYPCAHEGYSRCAEYCPIHRKFTQEGHGEWLCQLEWAQVPYESEAVK